MYKRQVRSEEQIVYQAFSTPIDIAHLAVRLAAITDQDTVCLLYTSDAADERSSVDLGGRRIIKKKNNVDIWQVAVLTKKTTKLCYTEKRERK